MLRLKRVISTSGGIFGVLLGEDGPLALTAERPWLDNAADVSCIPPGRYRCLRHVSPRFGETFMVTDVPGRTEILFHRGNVPTDSRGCILVGGSFGRLGPEAAVLGSKAAFGRFMRALSGTVEFRLLIEEVF